MAYLEARRETQRNRTGDRARWHGVVRIGALFLLAGIFALATGSLAAQQLDPITAELWYKDTPGIVDSAHTGDEFGAAMATCDFDADGYEDLAVGSPGDGNFGNLLPEAGAVNIIYGGPSGLHPTGDQSLVQNSGSDLSDEDDRFGSALAAGFFNLDGYCDLAVGVPGEDVDGQQDAGSVHIFFGSEDGLGTSSAVLYQTATGLPVHGSTPEPFDQFGQVLVTGHFNNDFYTDLAIGAPLENWADDVNAGHITVYHGSAGGLVIHSGWYQDRADLQDTAEHGDEFGFAMAAGDFDANGCDDLAVGIPGEDVDGTIDVGAVQVIQCHDDGTGLHADLDLFYSQHSAGITSLPEEGDRWGAALAAGNFDGDDYVDLAVGAPNEGVGSDANAGAVGVLYGSGLGPFTGSYENWTENSLGNASEPGDQWGYSLATGDIDGDGLSDLLVGAPFEDTSFTNPGAFTVMYGDPGGLTDVGAARWTQQEIGIAANEDQDYFGSALVFGDFDGNGHDEVAVSAIGEDVPCTLDCGGAATSTDAGAVVVMGDGFVFGDGFEAGDTTAWSSSTP